MNRLELGRIAFPALLASALLLASSSASAEDYRIGFVPSFGFGGEIDLNGGDNDLDPTAGFAPYFEFVFSDFFTFGAQLDVLFWEVDGSTIDPNVWLNIAGFPKVRYSMLGGDFDIYARIPIGLTISIPSSDLDGVDTGVGWMVAVLFGASYKIWSELGVMLEMGWRGQGGSNDTDGGGEIDYEAHQFAFNFGLFWGF